MQGNVKAAHDDYADLISKATHDDYVFLAYGIKMAEYGFCISAVVAKLAWVIPARVSSVNDVLINLFILKIHTHVIFVKH